MNTKNDKNTKATQTTKAEADRKAAMDFFKSHIIICSPAVFPTTK